MEDVKALFSSSEKRKYVIANIRNDPLEFLTSNKLSEERLLLCICKVLDQADDDYGLKSQILILLQESSELLVTNNECLEEAVIALNDLFAHLKSAHNFMKGQVLVTVTVILLNYKNQSENCESFRSLFISHCELLWLIAGNLNSTDNCILREMACECLIEIEECYPCIFLSKLKDVERLTSKEMLYPYQGYACLVSLIWKNADRITPSLLTRTNILLALMKNPPMTNDMMQLTTTEIAQTGELTKLLALVPIMSTASVCYMLYNILETGLSDDFYFKTFVHRFMLSSDLAMFQLVLKVKQKFDEKIVNSEEVDNLTRVLISKCNNLSLSVPSRLLLMDWVVDKLQSQPKSVAVSLQEMEKNFLPGPLDVLEIQEKKMKILAQLDHDFCNQKFFEHIEKLYQQIAFDQDGRYATVYFRLLYRYLSLRSSVDSDKVALEMVRKTGYLFSKDYPLFAMHHLDFVRKIKKLAFLGEFADDVLSASVLRVTELPAEKIFPHLEHFLTFLAEVAVEDSGQSQPKSIITFLSKVLSQRCLLKQSTTSSWLSGHLLLNVCKNLLRHHDENYIFNDFGDVLYAVMTEFDDVDVRDRAQAYYMLLTSLSPRKITAMFEPKIRNTKGSFVPGIQKSSYDFAAPVIHLPIPVLRLSRVENARRVVGCLEINTTEYREVDDIVAKYFCFAQEFNVRWISTFEQKLEIVEDSSHDLEECFGIVLTFNGPESCGEINSVKVLHVTKKEGVSVSIQLKPKRPLPATLAISAMFNNAEGRVCFNALSPMRLEFDDLLQPLPVPSDMEPNATLYRRQLASQLFQEFSRVKADKNYHLSVMRLLVDENGYRKLLSEAYLEDYVTEKIENDGDISAVVGMMVPQRSFLILKVVFKSVDNIIVNIATDDVDVLPQINDYLLKFETNYNLTTITRQ